MKNTQEKTTDNKEWFQNAGLRVTKTRRALLDILREAKSPQSVPELQKAFAQRKMFPHKTTLYREVEQLVTRGLLSKVQLSEAHVSYELSGDHHHHFVCQNCERVTKLSFCEDIMKTLGETLQRQGKHVTRHTFEFFGVCEFCY